MKKFYYCILYAKYILHHLLLLFSKNKPTIENEINTYCNIWSCKYPNIIKFIWLLECHPEFRSLFYYRNPNFFSKILSKIFKGETNLYLQVPQGSIGQNLIIYHGFSTIINCESIGENCSIWQQVTIGNKLDKEGRKPRIGNNVKICAGAIIVGNVEIGDNVIIGAGAVVTKSIPSNSIAIGVPAKSFNI